MQPLQPQLGYCSLPLNSASLFTSIGKNRSISLSFVPSEKPPEGNPFRREGRIDVLPRTRAQGISVRLGEAHRAVLHSVALTQELRVSQRTWHPACTCYHQRHKNLRISVSGFPDGTNRRWRQLRCTLNTLDFLSFLSV